MKKIKALINLCKNTFSKDEREFIGTAAIPYMIYTIISIVIALIEYNYYKPIHSGFSDGILVGWVVCSVIFLVIMWKFIFTHIKE